MKLWHLMLVALALSGSSCHWSTEPQPRHIYGVVRYTGSTPVERAKVWTDAGAVTFSDALGRYTIVAPASAVSITLFARDG